MNSIPEPVSERTPKFRNIHLSNITGQTKDAVFINGLEEMPVENITFNDIQFDAQRGVTIKEAQNIEFYNVTITTTEGSTLVAENVSGLTIDNIKTMKPIAGKPLMDMNNVQDVFVYNCNPVKNTDVILQLKGKDTKGIILKNNDFKNALKPLTKDESVVENVIVE